VRTVLRLSLGALVVGASLAFVPGAGAQDCPTTSIVIYDDVAYVSESVPSSVTLTLGDQLGDAELDTASTGDPCKRKRSPATAVRIEGVDPRVAVAVAAHPGDAFVVPAACSGYEKAGRWQCLLEPLTLNGESYTGVRYPGAEPERGVPFGDPLGSGELAGAAVTAVGIEGVDPKVAVGLQDRPGEAFVAPGVCPYEHFAVAGALNDLLRCLRSPLWLILDPPGGVPGADVTARGDRPATEELRSATVSLAPIEVAGNEVQADFAGAVPVGRLASLSDGGTGLQFAIPELEPGPYEAVITCEPCAASYGGETTFPAGLFRVTEKPAKEKGGGTSSVQLVGIVMGVLLIGLLIASFVLWRKGYRIGRRRKGGAGTQ
jgi:hypothetical protein